MSKRFAELLLLLGFLALAVLLYRSTASYPPFVQGSTAAYVRFLGWTLGLLCAAQLLLFIKSRGGGFGQQKLRLSADPRRFWPLLILLALYCWALGYLGFFLSSALFLPATMLGIGYRRPLPIVFTTAGILIFVYYVFAKLLEVSLPKGSLL